LNRSVRGVLASLAIGALVVGCSSSATTAPSQASSPAPSVAPATSPAASATPTAAPSATPAKQSITLSLLASQDWIRPAEQDLAKKFEAQTGIHIDYQIIPSANYFQVLNTKLNSGEGPDIFMGQSGVSDLKVTLNVEVNAVDLSGEEWVTREDPGALAQTTLNGKVYGQEIWDYAGGEWVIVYNKDIFQKVGITSVPATFNDLVAASDKIKAAGYTPIFEPISDGWHHVLWFPEAGPRFEELEPGLAAKLNANQATFAGDQNIVTAMTQINTLYQKGYFGSNALSAKEADTNKLMASGKYAMTVTQLSRPAGIHADFPNVPESTFGYFAKPILDNQLQPLNAAAPTKFVWSKGSHIAEAKQFLAFLAQPENLQYLVDNEPRFLGVDFSGVKGKWSAEQQAFLTKYPAKTGVYQTAVNYVNPQWMDIGKDMVAMFTGKETPAQVLTNIDNRRKQEATAAKDPAWSK
jgi:raffinose/stachyose/melibiose transport system substrate-binding protein